MTPTDKAAIRARLNAATPGPWECNGSGTVIADLGSLIEHGNTWTVIAPKAGPFSHALEDAVFIAAARQDVEALLAEVERLERILDKERGLSLVKENARLREELALFKVHGSDGCSKCETGRITLFVKSETCLSCAREALGEAG